MFLVNIEFKFVKKLESAHECAIRYTDQRLFDQRDFSRFRQEWLSKKTRVIFI